VSESQDDRLTFERSRDKDTEGRPSQRTVVLDADKILNLVLSWMRRQSFWGAKKNVSEDDLRQDFLRITHDEIYLETLPAITTRMCPSATHG
jgi:hypothetical protein